MRPATVREVPRTADAEAAQRAFAHIYDGVYDLREFAFLSCEIARSVVTLYVLATNEPPPRFTVPFRGASGETTATEGHPTHPRGQDEPRTMGRVTVTIRDGRVVCFTWDDGSVPMAGHTNAA